MLNTTEDTNRNIRTILFLVLFSLLLLSSTGNQENHYTSSIIYSAVTELLSGGFSDNHNTVQCRTYSVPDLHKFCECTPRNTDLIPFSIRNKISDYNRRIAQNFILIQNTLLSIEAIPPLRVYFHLPSDKDNDLPVLS